MKTKDNKSKWPLNPKPDVELNERHSIKSRDIWHDWLRSKNDKGLWVLTFATIVFQNGLHLFDVLQVISCNLSWFLGPHPKLMKSTQQWAHKCCWQHTSHSADMNPDFVHVKFQVSTWFKVWRWALGIYKFLLID
jgi:hypothetical protein